MDVCDFVRSFVFSLISSAVECESRVGCKFCPVDPSKMSKKECKPEDTCLSWEPGECGQCHPVM